MTMKGMRLPMGVCNRSLNELKKGIRKTARTLSSVMMAPTNA